MANLIWKKFYHLITASESGSQVCKQYSVDPSEMEDDHKLVPNRSFLRPVQGLFSH